MDHNNFFNSIGFGLPENSDEKEVFEKLYSEYEFKTANFVFDAEKILRLAKEGQKATNIDYHKRTVLAAEIVYQLKDEWTLGHLKLQKLLYLCQNIGNMNIHANFSKQMLGPYDPRLMRSLDKKFVENNWFLYSEESFPKYKHLESAGEHKIWYERYFSQYFEEVEFLINTFRRTKTNRIELIATIYACWDKMLNGEGEKSEDMIIEMVYDWSSEKKKFQRKDIISTIAWMKDVGVSPESR